MRVVVIGSGPAGLTASLLLARAGHRVTVLEKDDQFGGLWSARFTGDGLFCSENSCKVYQGSYHSAPALFKLIGTDWHKHFIARHDLKKEWLKPFLEDCCKNDRRKMLIAFLAYITHLKSFRKTSVYDYLEQNNFSEPFKKWMRATVLGGITGTMRMTMWELFHRFRFNLFALFVRHSDALYWNAIPPNSDQGFISIWLNELKKYGVQMKKDCATQKITVEGPVKVYLADGTIEKGNACFFAVPPPALAHILSGSPAQVSQGWGIDKQEINQVLQDSIYRHLGITWIFDQPLPGELPLGGYAVREGWHPILVQYDQYTPFAGPQAKTVVIASVSLDTDFRHPRLGTRASEHTYEELGRILWQDEQLENPALPDPVATHIYGLSSATQIVHHGPLNVKNNTLPLYLATSLNGWAPYFTASLESAIQAGNAAARAFDGQVEQLPV